MNIAIVTGGNSSEYEISLKSADAIINNIDRSIYNPYRIVIRDSNWILQRINKKDIIIDKNDFSCIVDNEKIIFDCVFIAIHGTPGEDGKIQGYFDMLKIPYTTPGVLTSALTFNKDACKIFLKEYGVILPDSVLIKKKEQFKIEDILSKIDVPCFVKPNSGGSSCGMSMVIKKDDLGNAIIKAFEEDDEILVEELIRGKELTCGIVRNKGELIIMPITEVISKNEFFDYEAKYTPGMAEEITPARITEKHEIECKKLSGYLYNVLDCKGIVRFDYILSEDKLFFLEVNTVPGLTETSFIPQQSLAMGISLEKLFGMVIEDTIQYC